MKKLLCLALLFLSFEVSSMSVFAAVPASGSRETELMSAAVDLGHRYDAYYAAKDVAGMTSLYTSEGIFLSVSGQVVQGKSALEKLYSNNFSGGGQGHSISVSEVHTNAAGGFAIAKFSINVPKKDGGFNKVEGNLVLVLVHGATGWSLALVAPSIAPGLSK